jgi:hypothetical protein
MPHETQPSEGVRKDALPRNPKAIYAGAHSSRVGIMDDPGSIDFSHGSRCIPVLARLASSSFGFRKRHSCLAGGQFSSRTILDLDCGGLASRCIRRGIADGPHGSASVAYDICPCADLGGRAGDTAAARFAAANCANRSWSTVAVSAGAVDWTCALATRVLLVCRGHDVGRMAHSGRVYAGAAIRRVAHGRARMFPRRRLSFLVARCSALAQCPGVASMVDSLVPVSRYVALRHSFRISCVFRASCLPSVPVHIATVRPLRSRRPAVCRCVDVDVRHGRLPSARGDSHRTAIVAANLPGG